MKTKSYFKAPHPEQKVVEKRTKRENSGEGFVNKYHFMRVGPDVLKALGWEITGDRLQVELDLKDDALIVRKPSK